MTSFYVPLTLFLAVIFGVSAIGKLRTSDHGRAGFDALKIRVAHPDTAALGLIIAEAAVAIALVSTDGWPFVATSAAALVLTVGLLIAVVRAHRLGATDDCGCFGDWLPAAIGPRLIARNVVLVVIAAAVFLSAFVYQGLMGAPLGVPHSLASSSAALTEFGAMVAVVLIALATWATARASSDASGADPLSRGDGAVLLPARGEVIDVLAPAMRARLLLFVSPGCHACATALTRLRDVQVEVAAWTDVYVVQRVVHGTVATGSDHALPETAQFALDVGGSLASALGVGIARPVAALIGADGTQAGPLALGSDETAQLINSIVALADAPTA